MFILNVGKKRSKSDVLDGSTAPQQHHLEVIVCSSLPGFTRASLRRNAHLPNTPSGFQRVFHSHTVMLLPPPERWRNRRQNFWYPVIPNVQHILSMRREKNS